MRRKAVSAAVLAFMVLALVGTACDVPPSVCSLRAVIGAGVVYVLVMVAGRIAVSVVVDAMLQGRAKHTQVRDENGGHAS